MLPIKVELICSTCKIDFLDQKIVFIIDGDNKHSRKILVGEFQRTGTVKNISLGYLLNSLYLNWSFMSNN